MDNDLHKYVQYIDGMKKGNILVFALSNCAWCRKIKQLLNEIGVEYSYIDADSVKKEDRQKLMETLERWNPACIFPTVVINEHTCIMGVDEPGIREALEEQHSMVLENVL